MKATIINILLWALAFGLLAGIALANRFGG